MFRTRTLAVAFALSLAAVPAKAQEFVNVLTGGTSGVYYPLGVALADIYGKGIEGARTQVQATKASVENLNLLQQGKGEIAFALGDSVKLAAEGNTEAGFPGPLDKLRGIAAIYPNYIQIVAAQESGIKTLADLKGKSLSVGAPASGTELNARAIFAAAGMKYEDLGKVEYLPFAESVELIKILRRRCRSSSLPCRPTSPPRSARPISPLLSLPAPMRARTRTSRPRLSATSSSRMTVCRRKPPTR
jgi:TRAP transporter TAXI family solute receptor